MNGIEPPDLPPDVIECALDGDPTAFRKLYHRYDPTLRWAVGLRVRRWPELEPAFEDVVQDVWCELMRRKGKRLRYHTGDRGTPFWRYLAYVSARYGWKLAKRRLAHSEQEAELAERGTSVLDEADEIDLVQKLIEADLFDRLAARVDAELDEVERRIFHENLVGGDTLRAIAKRLGVKENALHQRKHRMHAKLRALVDELLAEPGPRSPELVAMVVATLYALAQGGLGGLAGIGGGS
jgi:RNA polymerase sigma factor (sigma-70 family)